MSTPPIHSTEYKLFSDYLRITIQKSGHTQVQLAEKLGKPQSYISKCLSRERRMGIVEIYRMCHAIDISLADFAREIERMFDEVQTVNDHLLPS